MHLRVFMHFPMYNLSLPWHFQNETKQFCPAFYCITTFPKSRFPKTSGTCIHGMHIRCIVNVAIVIGTSSLFATALFLSLHFVSDFVVCLVANAVRISGERKICQGRYIRGSKSKNYISILDDMYEYIYIYSYICHVAEIFCAAIQFSFRAIKQIAGTKLNFQTGLRISFRVYIQIVCFQQTLMHTYLYIHSYYIYM